MIILRNQNNQFCKQNFLCYIDMVEPFECKIIQAAYKKMSFTTACS